MSTTTQCDESIIRRSANYEPSIWSYDYIQSLRNPYVGESYSKRIEKLKGDVRVMLEKAVDLDPLQQSEFVDTLQRLGISYHFEKEIKEILNNIYNNYEQKRESLYAIALHFRLLRQHGYHIPADVFSNFRDEKGNFNSCLGDDCKGILSLYEAAHLLIEGENDIFHKTVNFTTKYLKQYVLEHNNNDEYLSSLVNHSLEIPLHWRVLRLEARWFIDLYETATDMNPVLLEFAKLDFNSVQATHQEDLKYASRWWKDSGLEKADFARNRVVQNLLWSVGIIFEPQFGYCRRMSTMSYLFITVIDDLYDVYGTVDELELFTDAVDRWDATAIEQLPEYMKHIFLSLYTSINEMASDALKEREAHIISYLTKGWSTLFNCYLKEAKWFNSGYIPTLQEYMDIAWFSVAGPVMIVHGFAAIANPATKESMEFFEQYYNIIRLCSTILRYANDLGTSTNELARGDIQKSIQIYMYENGVSEGVAREYIRNLIAETWMKVNKFRAENPQLSNIYMGIPLNLARMGICMYEHGDGHAVENCSKDRVLSLLINPIPCT